MVRIVLNQMYPLILTKLNLPDRVKSWTKTFLFSKLVIKARDFLVPLNGNPPYHSEQIVIQSKRLTHSPISLQRAYICALFSPVATLEKKRKVGGRDMFSKRREEGGK